MESSLLVRSRNSRVFFHTGIPEPIKLLLLDREGTSADSFDCLQPIAPDERQLKTSQAECIRARDLGYIRRLCACF